MLFAARLTALWEQLAAWKGGKRSELASVAESEDGARDRFNVAVTQLKVYLSEGRLANLARNDLEMWEVIVFLFAAEVWEKEGNYDCADPLEFVQLACSGKIEDAKVLLSGVPEEEVGRIALKAANVVKASKQYLSTEGTSNLDEHLVKGINAMVFDGMGVSSEWRTVNVKPAGSHFAYCMHEKVSGRINTLLSFVKTKMENHSELEDRLLIGCFFFSEFLLIHPFANGNGRTARILLSYLLKSDLVVPFSLARARQPYLDVLEQRMDGQVPCELAAYLAMGARRAAYNAEFLLMD